MKLAEALLERAELHKRVESLRARVVANASYQEGETPNEDAAQLLTEGVETTRQIAKLVAAINLTNATVKAPDGRSLTELLALRESLRMEHSLVVSAADAGSNNRGYRQMRSELRQMSALPVNELRARADALALELRSVDSLIQRTNWEADLLG